MKTTLGEVLRQVRSEGTFENWGHSSKQRRLEESSSNFRASTCLREAQTAIFEMDKLVSGEYSSSDVLAQLVSAMGHLAQGMEALGEPEAAGALDEVHQYFAELVWGSETENG